ncbi:MAG TPA: galactose-1-phosphate uridylyltransferase, partial [Candidatus Sulfotelmatobacter sp.]|nr:galactose-1-phosphate uridylyltransferase [Candidatus Sulfotelmatobacter sp.]
ALQYDPDCYLCPGNARAGGVHNPQYDHTFVFDNDYPALLPEASSGRTAAPDPLLTAVPEAGTCRVVCFSPRHDLTLPRMTAEELRAVVDVWVQQMVSLESISWVRYVQIFENRGALMGASNPHPHCQIWASASLPNLPQKEFESFAAYQREQKRCLLCDYLHLELERKVRIVCENEGFLAVVPFWALWPFEALILSKRHVSSLLQLTSEEKNLLGDILKRQTIRYDNLFLTSFPYSMGLHQRPSGNGEAAAWHFHLHFFPPLLRSATVQKFMVGYELLATPQRDITPEDAATRLATTSEKHYLD